MLPPAIRVIINSLKPTSLNCAPGEKCISAQYCAPNTTYVNGVCQPNK